jgi:hypothetical protein
MKPIYFLLILALALSGCTKATAPSTQVAEVVTDTPPPPATATHLPTATPTHTPTSTPTPAPTLTSTATPTVTPTADPRGIFFDSEWVQLYYPTDWKVAEPGEKPRCKEIGQCILSLTRSTPEDATITMSALTLEEGTVWVYNLDVDHDDRILWQSLELRTMLNKVDDRLKSISRTKIVVDGQPAIKRLYEYPQLDSTTNTFKGIEYTYRVTMIKGQSIYIFILATTNAEEFGRFQEIADQIVATIVLPK